ncbi:MAG: hypothetical protein JWM80_5135, partial [Cyanobacteria bacterium RYN_339]|nr:hypothetical protein [Cyanobacteria bacterium RYN_339]
MPIGPIGGVRPLAVKTPARVQKPLSTAPGGQLAAGTRVARAQAPAP